MLAGIILVFAGMRIQDDVPHIIDGTLPADDDFAERYIQHPVLAYLHIGFGVVYLLGGTLHLPTGSVRATTPCIGDWARCCWAPEW